MSAVGTSSRPAVQPARRRLTIPARAKNVGAPLIVAVVILVLWQAKVFHHLFGIETFAVPLPLDIVRALSDNHAELVSRARETLVPGLLGFLLGEAIGLVVASLLIALPARLGRQVTLLGAAVQSLPAVALVALVGFWVGNYTLLKIVVVAIMVAPSMLIYTFRGLTATKPAALELMASYNASGMRVLRSLRVPTAVPFLFTQVKYAMTIMLVAVVLSEVMVTGDGLGYEIEHYLSQFDTAIAWAAVAVLAFAGVVTYMLASLVERAVFPWAARQTP